MIPSYLLPRYQSSSDRKEQLYEGIGDTFGSVIA